MEENFKAGFVNILGNPNVGKSTLMNVLTGERLSIITAKAQTTRHRIIGITGDETCQIVFSDTPGILKPAYKLQDAMMEFVRTALVDADIFLYVTDVVEDPEKNAAYVDKMAEATVPVLVLINKVDLSGQKQLEELVEQWRKRVPNAEIIPISAREKFNTDLVMARIRALLPVHPPYYDLDALTDRPERFFVSEIFREKIFEHYSEEIPYCTEVTVESFKESEDIIRIQVAVWVARESQKGILIGRQGAAIKRTATDARKAMEQFFQKKVFLETFVKVQKDWRDSEYHLRHMGYIES
ncbi:MAG: GTPase Era [Bacteroidales bacterium]|nr:GTPase Era [Bacteroidales bacterium]